MKTTNNTHYTSKRLQSWIESIEDSEVVDSYDVSIPLRIHYINEEEVSTIRSLLNRLYEAARKFDLKINLQNLKEKLTSLISSSTCNHNLNSCNPKRNGVEGDVIQKMIAISNQTKRNKRNVDVVFY